MRQHGPLAAVFRAAFSAELIPGKQAGCVLQNKGYALEVHDLSNPAKPTQIGRIVTGSGSSRLYRLRASGGYVYMPSGNDGLRIFQVAGLTNLQFRARVDTSGVARAVEVSGDVAYLADQFAGLQILDVSNPAKPTRIGSYKPDAQLMSMVLSGSLVYLGFYSVGGTSGLT